MEITEESKALLEEYNKTVSFVLMVLKGILPSLSLLPLGCSSHSPPSCRHPSGHMPNLSASSFRLLLLP